MDTMQDVFSHQGDVSAETSPLSPPEVNLKAERVQAGLAPAGAGLGIRVTAERLQEPLPAGDGTSDTYVYEVAVSQRQPVTIELPLLTVTLHGDPAWGNLGGAAATGPAAAGRPGRKENGHGKH